MHALLLSIAATSALVDATISGTVNRVSDAGQNVPGCLQVGDHIVFYTRFRTTHTGTVIGGDAGIILNDGKHGQATSIVGEPLDDRWQLDIRYPTLGDRTAAAGFPVPGLMEWNIIGTNCMAEAGPMEWEVTTYPAGDANMDGVFNSADLVEVFRVGKYRTIDTATWSEGDWNGDGLFTTKDFVVAFVEGAYTPDAVAIPEPSALTLFLLGLLITKHHIRTRYPRCGWRIWR